MEPAELMMAAAAVFAAIMVGLGAGGYFS
jgi:hypothetical protein